jgi:hypothetical protein
MGYTHRYVQGRDATRSEWKAITAATLRLLANLPERNASAREPFRHAPLKLCLLQERGVPDGDLGQPVVTNDEITFEGAGKHGTEFLGHETFFLRRNKARTEREYLSDGVSVSGEDLQLCKTEQKPYDLVVCAVLIVANHLAPGCWEITSDGTKAEWHDALVWVASVALPGEPRILLPRGIHD